MVGRGMAVAIPTVMLRYLVRLAASLVVLALVPQLAPIAALGVFFALFVIAHDAGHGALGLSRRATDAVLAIAGVGIGTSGHAFRLTHMRHHSHALAADDLEGAAAGMTFWRALLHAPRLAVVLRAMAWRLANRSQRRWQVVEYLGVAAAAVGAVFGPRQVALYAAVTLALQATAPWWAGHIPHRSSALIALARRLGAGGSILLASLAHHDVHHRHPKLPTWRLHDATR
jgi:fatty acid desaturase